MSKHNTGDWDRFQKEIYILDKVRKESFWDTFPEIAKLRQYE